MSPSSGHILVPEALKAFKYMVSKGAAYVKARLPQGLGATKSLEAIPLRIARQPIHPLAALRQSRGQQRNFSTAIRRIIASVKAPVQASRPLAGATIRSALAKSSAAPFSSPLRPNLVGGAIPRSSGGYTLGGNGIRHFSSTPFAQAHVVQNVSAAVRAFIVNGSKAQYNGKNARTGRTNFKAVSAVQEQALKQINDSRTYNKGTTLEFSIAPSITAIPTMEAEATLGTSEVISGLASDFAHSLSALAMVHSDLKKLSTLGSLPISHPNPYTLSVRFAGCDARTVYALCDELGIRRGVVREDPEWDVEEGDKEVEMALLFPWAPSQTPTDHLFVPIDQHHDLGWQDMMSKSTIPSEHHTSHDGYSVVHTPLQDDEFSNPWNSARTSPHFDMLNESDIESNEDVNFGADLGRTQTTRQNDTSAYEGMEGMLRFFEQCETRR